jgi:hypothetical protein
MLGDIGDYLKATIGEIGQHPWQAAGAAFGIPGFDPAIGGIFNNRPGGALISPTGNFTSSAWNDMYKNNPNSTGALDTFHKVNSVADVVAPIIAGGFASGALGGAGSAASSGGGGLSGLFGGSGAGIGTGVGTDASSGLSGITGGAGGLTGFFSGPAAYGDSGLTGAVSGGGSGLSGAMGGDLGGALGSSPTGLFSGLLPGGGMTGTSSGALGGGLSGDVAGMSPLGGATMGGFNFSSLGNLGNLGQNLLQQKNQQPQPMGQAAPRPFAFGNPHVSNGVISPQMPYAQFNNAGSQLPLSTALLMQNGGQYA